MDPNGRPSFRRTLLALLLFGAAFGYLEAAVVTYLRHLHEPAGEVSYAGRAAGDLFQLFTLEKLHASNTLAIEVGREAATLVMLAAVALAVAGTGLRWIAAFLVAFGAWDIFFYIFLRTLLGWPSSLLTWDILFLIPVPWAGPVLAPALVSIAMIATGAHVLWVETRGARVSISPLSWCGIIGGAVVILIAFVWDFRDVRAGGMPERFHWEVFGAGLALGVASYCSAVGRHAERTNPGSIQAG